MGYYATRRKQHRQPKPKYVANVKFRLFGYSLLSLFLLRVGCFSNTGKEKGVQITIDFQSASGIVSGNTYPLPGVDVGIVQDVTLSNDLRRVIVTADIPKKLC